MINSYNIGKPGIKQLFSFIAFMLALSAQAQDSLPAKQARPRVAFSTSNQIGVMNGEGGTEPIVQSVNGVRYKDWFAGIGVGLDYYELRSFPVFLEIRRHFFDKPRTQFVPFVYADGGVHFTWAEKDDKLIGYENKFSHGLYMDAGIGCGIRLKEKQSLFVSMGYSRKEVKHRLLPEMEWQERGYDSPLTYDYNFNRLSFKIGWQL